MKHIASGRVLLEERRMQMEHFRGSKARDVSCWAQARKCYMPGGGHCESWGWLCFVLVLGRKEQGVVAGAESRVHGAHLNPTVEVQISPSWTSSSACTDSVRVKEAYPSTACACCAGYPQKRTARDAKGEMKRRRGSHIRCLLVGAKPCSRMVQSSKRER
jgi:hypothetical protein